VNACGSSVARFHHLLAFACIATTLSARAQDEMPRQPVATGALVRQVCAPCHGLDGNSTRTSVPSLAGQIGAYLEGQLHAFAAQGGQRPNGVMGAIAVNLSADDMKRAAGYYSRQTLRPTTLVEVRRQGRAEGAALFGTGLPEQGVASCASCHGTRGEGLPDLFPRLAGQSEPYLVEQLRQFRAGNRSSDPAAMMRELAARLSDAQIDAVSRYMARLR
jgi:cytochrome c553